MQEFKEWYKSNLVDFLSYFKYHFPKEFEKVYNSFDEMKRGN